jgi:hypothetical protein
MATDSGKRFLSARERRTVEAFAEVFIEGDHEVLTPAQVAAAIDEQLVERSGSKRTRSLRLVLFGIEYLFPLVSLRLRPFSRLSYDARHKLINDHLSRAKAGSPLRNLAKLRALFLGRLLRRPGRAPQHRLRRDPRPLAQPGPRARGDAAPAARDRRAGPGPHV